jgi:histidinol phosphatase-like enzyme (inositol monophosphatase family)
VDQAETQRRYEVAQQIAISAGKLTLNYFQTDDFDVIRKADNSPLTIADKESETHLREVIRDHFPDDAIVGEEFGVTEGSSGFRWILDPIDGTKSFISGVPLYGTMVAVDWGAAGQSQSDRKTLIGANYFPGLDEGIHAMRGNGAWAFRRDNEPFRAQVSKTSNIQDAVIVTSEAEGFSNRKVDAREVYRNLVEHCYFARTWGDVYGYMLVATGRVEIMIDAELNIWDAAAVQPIIEEAGGTFTDWEGRSRIDSGDAFATNGLLHEQVLSLLVT